MLLPGPSLAESNMKAIIRATSERKRGRERRGKGKKKKRKKKGNNLES